MGVAVLDDRSRLLRSVAALLLAKATAHPLRIGIDGRTAAGNTTFADDLASELGRSGRQILRAGADDFHHPAAVRHR
jgi:uridine kinase